MKIFTKSINASKLTLVVFLLSSVYVSAQLQQAFTPRFNEAVNGDFTIIANNTISTSATGNYTGGGNNDGFSNLVYVDIDNDATTFNSSNADFANPAPGASCLNIKKVYLYWAAADQEPSGPGSDNQPTWNFNDIKLMLPSETAYTTYTADEVIYRGLDTRFSNAPYICVKEITTEVTNLMNNSISPYGTYQVANVEGKIGSLNDYQTGIPTGVSGGWQIVFVYESPTLPRKNIAIFDGYAHVKNGSGSYNIDFNGFQTVPTGNVSANILVGALEGDQGYGGDRLQIENVSNTFIDLSTSPTAPIRTTSNFFNSRITIDNNNFLDRVPASTNTLGFDAAVFQLDNPGNTIIGNNQTSATIRLTSNQETYGLFLLGLSVDIWAPDFSNIQLTLDTASTTFNPGDTFGGSFSIENKGNDNAKDLKISATLPPQVMLVEDNLIPTPSFPTGVTYTYNPVTNFVEFSIPDDIVEAGDPGFNIDFDFQVKDACFFLEDNCDLDFNLQLIASYSGEQNPEVVTTNSSANLDACGVGIKDPILININQPSISWQTLPNSLDRTIECDDINELNNAQALFPSTNICTPTLVKTSGPFVEDVNCQNAGTYTNSWSFTDECGETLANFTQTITIIDTTAPTIDTPASDSTVQCDGAGNTSDLNTWLSNNGGATASDSCGGVTWANDFSALSDDCGETGSATVTFTATDDCGNSSTTTATFTIEDATPPTIDTPASDSTVQCDGAGNTSDLNTWLSNNGGATASDTCGGVTWSNDFSTLSDDCGETGTATVTFTATDDCGNTSTTTAIFTIEDTTPPTIDTAASDSIIECDGTDTIAVLTAWLNSNGGATASDSCSDVTWSNDYTDINYICAVTGSVTIVFTATDDCGNSNSTTATFTVTDNTPPTIDTAASDNTVQCDGAGNTSDLNTWLANNGGAVASDTCSNVTWSNDFSALSDDCGETGTATVTFTATDDCGNSSTTTATFTIEDTTPATIDTAASNSTVECDGAGNTSDLNTWLANNGGAVASDACSNVTWSNDFSALSDDCGETGTATVTFTATDDCGNSSTTAATFTIEDTTPPTINTAASNSTVECDGAGNTSDLNTWLANNGGAVASDACSNVTWSNDFSALSDDCGETGTATVTFTATDDCGNSSTTTATFTIEDTTAPSLTVPADITVECTADTSSASTGEATSSDTCGDVTITQSDATVAGPCGNTVIITRTWTATDACGNSTSQTQTITTEDTTAPTLNVPADVTIECTEDESSANTGLATGSDTCGDVTITESDAVVTACGNSKTITRTWTATDACGNSTSGTQTITVEDTTPPTLTVPADVTIECTEDESSANTGVATASDTCGDVTITESDNVVESCGNTKTITRTWTATDACGNETSNTQTITVVDTTPPVIDNTNTANIEIECGVTDPTDLDDWLNNNAGATATDTCGTVAWSNDYGSDNSVQCDNGAITVTFTATDECGNSSSTTATYLIKDTDAPTITQQASNETVECDGAGNTSDLNTWLSNNGGATATDACSTVTWSNDFSALSDDCGETGSATVTFTATDACGNTSTTTATFTIEDTTAPSLTLPDDVTVECTDDTSSANTGVATSTDTCGNVTITQSDVSVAGPCGNTVVITRTWTATDECGNATSAVQTITTEDTTPPTLTVPADVTIECTEDESSANNGVATASDTCGDVTITESDNVVESCGNTKTITRTWTATDACGNETSNTQTITVVDTIPPVIDNTNTANIEIECGVTDISNLDDWLNNNAGATATDTCGIVAWSNDYGSDNSVQCDNGAITVTFTATDECGNSSSTTATYLIKDTDAPTITQQASNETVECDGAGNTSDLNTWLSNNGGATATDACSTVTWSNDFSALSDDCGETGSATVTFTATDACGNTSTTTATFTIEDTTAPSLTLPDDVTVECTDDTSSANTGVATSTDTCGNVTITQSDVSVAGPCGNTVVITRTWTATDECGNATSAVQTITTEDTTPPTLTVPADVTIECTEDESSANNGVATASDTCGDVTITESDNVVESCGNTKTITRTWTATDACGNETSNTQTITVVDTIPPVIDNTNTANIEIECGVTDISNLDDWLNNNAGATATDTCGIVAWSNDYGSDNSVQCDNGAITVTFTATDECGNSSSTTATYLIKDTDAPTITQQASNETVECDGAGNTSDLNTWLSNNGGATATDACSTVTWSNDFSALSDDCGETGSATVTFTATDACGNTSTTTATFTIEDTTAPSLTLPDDVTVECTDDTSSANTGVATSTDTCGNVTITQSDVSVAGLCGNTVVITRTWTATDECGNATSAVQTITTEDTTPPTLTVPADVTIECTEDESSANNGVATASDTCGDVTITESDNVVESCGNTKTITRTWTATDACGNETSNTQTITVVDTTPPVIDNTNTANIEIECGIGDTASDLDNWLNNNAGATATDTCGTVTWSNNYGSDTSVQCDNGAITVTFTATDECGNASTTTATYLVKDTQGPTVDTAQGALDVTIECSDVDGLSNALSQAPTASDDCSEVTIQLVSDITTQDPDCPNAYVQVRTWNFTDACDNVSENFVQTITIVDTTAPELTLPANVSAECSDDLSPVSFGVATATDNCDTNPIITFSDVRTDGECSGTFTITRTWTATDACGNSISADQIISTSDTTAPDFDQSVLPADVTVECTGVPSAETLTATDNCGDATVTVEDVRTDGNCPSNYTITRTYTATDDCGLTKTHVQIITVQDTTAPEFVESLPLATLVVECDSVPDAETLTATDNCGSASVTVEDIRTDGTCPNNYTIARTWTATDECGLTTTHTQTIIVQDTTAPVFESDLPGNVTVECDEIPDVSTIEASDNCGEAVVTVEDVRTDGDCPSNYIISRTWTATDECGLTTTHTQIITVQDTTAPTPSSTYEEVIDVSCTDIPEAPELTFTDNCTSNITVVFNETSTYEELAYEDYTITRTWTVRDECNNEAVYTQIVNVTLDEVITDVTAPDWCFDEGIVNLNDFIDSELNTDGSWEMIEGDTAATLNGNIFNPTTLELSFDFLPDDGGIDYRFRYTTTDGTCINITEVTMNVHADCVVLPCGEKDVVISKAITPNGDQFNETFEIGGIELCGFEYEVKIFNRWGALVYESDNYQNDWNGTSSGSSFGNAGQVPNGTYYYIINIKDSGLPPFTGPVYVGTK
ncbi:gliding motility-associated C-terminal domain-containing protein [Seonamhaeicola sp. ML3]|uniref:HYR-like domain-containing protein n=1 Tax=Seonamhaeicola sp. ML3 TaxID=2937786 RepID=UPI00200DE3D8|nr:gliding motility-associated C-terminal domain-containing protein [Seonamhaeicola sp. ML3]